MEENLGYFWGDCRTGFPHFYYEENLDYFGRIAIQGFHTFAMKRIWIILGGQQYRVSKLLQRRESGLFWGDSRTGFPHFYNEENLDYIFLRG
jgi:hypothetical protein